MCGVYSVLISAYCKPYTVQWTHGCHARCRSASYISRAPGGDGGPNEARRGESGGGDATTALNLMMS